MTLSLPLRPFARAAHAAHAAVALSVLILASSACAAPGNGGNGSTAAGETSDGGDPQKTTAAATAPADAALATFAGGCFWCMEPPFDKLDGVYTTTSGYAGGEMDDPTYQQVSSGRTGHTESLQVAYDPERVSYETLLDTFWVNVDPFDGAGQFCDRGSQYRPAIFTHDEAQAAAARASLERVRERFEGREIAVEIEALEEFFPAEEYHQDFYEKNPDHYKRYRTGCRRDARLRAVWGSDKGDTTP
jgi:peptide-methionine (S)-S-oxide reductase